MQLKNGNSVALERRMDLASLFCMIGRHGPAVALVVIAMVSVLVGFIIYRSVRGKKRRKATAAAGDGDGVGDGDSPGAQRDASGPSWPEQELSPGDPLSSSTDVRDEVWSGMKDDARLVHPELNLRHRRCAAVEHQPESDVQTPDEEATHNWSCETGVRVETETEDRGGEEVLEEVHGNEVLTRDERREEDEKVFEAEDRNDETETRDEDISVLNTSPEEEHFQSVLNVQVCFGQTPRMSDEDDTPETNGVEDCMDVPSIHIKAVSTCNGKDEEFEERNDHPDITDDSNYSSYHFSLKEEEENTGEEAEEEFCLIPQQDEICPLTCDQEPDPDHRDNETNEVTPQVPESDWRNGQPGEGTDEDNQEDLDTRPPQSDQEQQIEPQNDHQENGVVHTVTEEEESKTSDEAVLCGEGHGAPGVALVCSRVSEPDHDDLSGVDTDAEDQTSGVVDSLESTSDRQQPQSEESKEQILKPLEKDMDLTPSGPEVPSLQEELCNSELQVLTCDDHVSQTITNGAFDGCCDAAERDEEMSVGQDQTGDHMEVNDAAVSTSAICEDVSHPDTLGLSEDQERHQMQKSELRDQDEGSVSSPGVDAESGISSMAVSPDLQDVGNEFGETSENMAVPELDSDPQTEERTETENAKNDSFADNEDVFGHEIEDSYHRALEQAMPQIVAASVNTTTELSGQSDVKVREVEVKEKKEAAKKIETEAETEKEDDYEKTEISIMEATMDNNEWITDSNYQVLPWLNVPSFSQDPGHTSQPPADDHGSSLADDSRADADPVPAVDENTENNKKVVAVQPMPQNVNVTFRIHYLTSSPYQTVAVTGDQQELGNWKEFIPLERAKDGHWATVVSLPAESHVEWKFVLVEKGEVCRWEECGNRLLDTGYGDELTVHKWWGLL